jgi:hypothetical protein
MSTRCDAKVLMQDAKCLCGLNQSNKLSILIYLFAQVSGVSIDPNFLVEQAKCYCGIPADMKMNVLIWLACQFQGGGGNTCITCLDGANVPVDPSACDCAIAYNMNSQFWFWDSTGNTWMPILL